MPSDFPPQLTPAEIRLLRRAASGKIIPRSDFESRLRQLGYLELHPCGTSGPWNETVYYGSVITPSGGAISNTSEVKIGSNTWNPEDTGSQPPSQSLR